MTDTYTDTPEQDVARDPLITAVNGGINRWARVHGCTVNAPAGQIRAEGIDLADRSLWQVSLANLQARGCLGALLYRGACIALRLGRRRPRRGEHRGRIRGRPRLARLARPADRSPSALEPEDPPRWIAAVTAAFPAGWLKSGGPVRTARQQNATRHVPNRTGFGGYDLCVTIAETALSERGS
jgi:hypothetical protein